MSARCLLFTARPPFAQEDAGATIRPRPWRGPLDINVGCPAIVVVIRSDFNTSTHCPSRRSHRSLRASRKLGSQCETRASTGSRDRCGGCSNRRRIGARRFAYSRRSNLSSAFEHLPRRSFGSASRSAMARPRTTRSLRTTICGRRITAALTTTGPCASSVLPAFTPHENPFYLDLPYSDFDDNGSPRADRTAIPWVRRYAAQLTRSARTGKRIPS